MIREGQNNIKNQKKKKKKTDKQKPKKNKQTKTNKKGLCGDIDNSYYFPFEVVGSKTVIWFKKKVFS